MAGPVYLMTFAGGTDLKNGCTAKEEIWSKILKAAPSQGIHQETAHELQSPASWGWQQVSERTEPLLATLNNHWPQSPEHKEVKESAGQEIDWPSKGSKGGEGCLDAEENHSAMPK